MARPSLGPAQSPSTLEDLAMERYLGLLEEACAGYVQLSRHQSTLIQACLPGMLEAMKAHLEAHLYGGTASSCLRDEMMARLLRSGRFPTARYQNAYLPVPEMEAPGGAAVFFGTEQDKKHVEEICANGKKCNSLCCTGAFVVETMLCILLNEDVVNLIVDLSSTSDAVARGHQRFWNSAKVLKKYVHFQLPAILAHYARALTQCAAHEKTPRLRRLVIAHTSISSKNYALQNHYFDVYTAYYETFQYLSVPAALNDMAHLGTEGEDRRYFAGSEHLMWTLGRLFRDHTFNHLTEILLGQEACNTGLRVSGTQKNVGLDMFRYLGRACPRLRILDLSAAINLSAECLLFMCFRDAYHTLHRFAYLPEELWHPSDGTPVQNNQCSLDEIHRHSDRADCRWCYEGASLGHQNAEESPCRYADIHNPILDDRIYSAVETEFPMDAPLFLLNVVRVSDLVGCVQRPEDRHEVLNPLCQSLEALKLNMDTVWPKHEIVPFFFTCMPKIKSLGHINVIRGLKMIRDIPALSDIRTENLEEIDFGFGGSQLEKTNTGWCHNDVADYVEILSGEIFTHGDSSAEERLQILREDVLLLADKCPKLRRMKVFLFGDTPYLQENDVQTWQPLSRMTQLTHLQLMAHLWSESVALLKVLSAQLGTLYLSLDGRSSMWNNFGHPWRHIPQLEEILVLCPQAQGITLSFGVKNVQVSSDSLSDQLVFPNLKRLTVHTFMTKRALSYLWARASNLESLKINIVTNNDDESADLGYDELDVMRLLRQNCLARMTEFNVSLTLKSIGAARFLVESLPQVSEMGTLSIRVGLPQEDYNSQEEMLYELAQIMQAMREFKVFCEDRGRHGVKIRWKWKRFGFLESFSQLEQLNALIEPSV